MSRFEQEQQQVADAIASFPREFGLRAFPGKRFRIAHASSCFVSEGDVQIVVQVHDPIHAQRIGRGDEPWLDFGRNTPDHLRRELVTLDAPTPPALTVTHVSEKIGSRTFAIRKVGGAWHGYISGKRVHAHMSEADAGAWLEEQRAQYGDAAAPARAALAAALADEPAPADDAEPVADLAAGWIQTFPSELIAAVVRGDVDLNAVARAEFASRGIDLAGKWVGFERSKSIANAQTILRGDGRAVRVTVPDSDAK